MKKNPYKNYKKLMQTPLILIQKICQMKIIKQKNRKKVINNVINKSKELKKI